MPWPRIVPASSSSSVLCPIQIPMSLSCLALVRCRPKSLGASFSHRRFDRFSKASVHTRSASEDYESAPLLFDQGPRMKSEAVTSSSTRWSIFDLNRREEQWLPELVGLSRMTVPILNPHWPMSLALSLRLAISMMRASSNFVHCWITFWYETSS